MSSRIDSNAGTGQRQAYPYRRQPGLSAEPAKTELKANRDVSSGAKAAATAALGGSNDLKRISDSRKLALPIDELAGIKDLDARFYVHGGANRRVVQLREARSSKLVRQVPDQDAIARLTSMRRYVGGIIDFMG